MGTLTLQLPQDWGPSGEKRNILRGLVTSRARGRVLEAMCGFTSYVDDASHIGEVVAMDYCREGLERCCPSERTRILHDLNGITRGERMDFFPPASFQTVIIAFGVNYLDHPSATYQEFRDLLDTAGKIIIVGGTNCGYSDLVKHTFKPEETRRHLISAGFQAEGEWLPLRELGEFGEYFMIEGTKDS